MKTLPTESHPDLIALINETYTDDVEQILSAATDDNGNIICLAQDGGKQLAIKISDTEIQVKLYNPALVEVETQFAAPDDDDPIDPILAQLKPIGNRTFMDWFETLQSMMQESENLVKFRDKLTDAYPDLDAAEFKQAMLDASTVAGMRGYDDARVDDELEFAMSDLEVEFKIPEGTIKEKNGKTYVLKGSRWRLAEPKEKKDVETEFTARIPEGTVKGDRVLHNSRWHKADEADILKANSDSFDFFKQQLKDDDDLSDMPDDLIQQAAQYQTLWRYYNNTYAGDPDKQFEKVSELVERFQYAWDDDDLDDEQQDRIYKIMEKVGI